MQSFELDGPFDRAHLCSRDRQASCNPLVDLCSNIEVLQKPMPLGPPLGLAPACPCAAQQVALLGTPTPQSSLASPAQAHALLQNCEQVPQGE